MPRAETGTPPRGVRLPLAGSILAAAAALGIALAPLVHGATTLAPGPALPELHGEATWAPGSRPAPAPTPRGRTTAVAFLGAGCSPCLAELRRVVRRLPAADRPVVVLAPADAAAAYGVARGRRVLVLVDRHGDERTGYAFPFAPPFVEGDLLTLAGERS